MNIFTTNTTNTFVNYLFWLHSSFLFYCPSKPQSVGPLCLIMSHGHSSYLAFLAEQSQWTLLSHFATAQKWQCEGVPPDCEWWPKYCVAYFNQKLKRSQANYLKANANVNPNQRQKAPQWHSSQLTNWQTGQTDS